MSVTAPKHDLFYPDDSPITTNFADSYISFLRRVSVMGLTKIGFNPGVRIPTIFF